MAEIRINATGGLKLYDADDSHYAQIVAGTITSNTDVMTLGHAAVVMGTKLDMNGSNLVLDADADTYLDTGTDDTIKFYVSGAHDLTIGANAINVLSGTTLTIDSGATITNSGTANGFGGADPSSADGDTLGTASAEWSDLYLADGGVVYLGNDQDVTLTHVADTGVLLNSTRKIQFGDSATFIHQSSDGVMTVDGEATIDLNASTAVLVSNDLKLNSDAAVLGFGADNDVTLTHVADTGVLLNSTMAIQFNDASQYINAPSNAILDINATDEIELNATAVDLNGTLDVSGASTLTGLVTIAAGIKFPGTQNVVADVNTLDDYEEGTADVTYTSTSGSITINTGSDTINYVKIGKIVNITGNLIVSSVSSPSGTVNIAGLPFTAEGSSGTGGESHAALGCRFDNINDQSCSAPIAYVVHSGTAIDVRKFTGTDDATSGDLWKATSAVMIGGCYVATD